MAGWSETGTSLTTTDNVGIGTTNPQSALHANGTVTVSAGTGPDSRVALGGSLVRSEADSAPISRASGRVHVVELPGSKLSLATSPSGPATLSRAPIDRLVIDATGRIGIGARAPLATLDVRGHACFQGAVSLNKAGVSGVESDPRAALTFGATDSSSAFLLGTSDANATTANASLGVYSYEFKDFLQYWAPNGNIGIGTATPETKLHVNGDVTVSGDILLAGADCAEHFDVTTNALLEPGTVVVIDESGALGESQEPYDRKVAGVISGAGSYRPALLLDSQTAAEGRVPVALVGKVFCKVDATKSPVEFGDLLTTASRPGHAMKAADPTKAFGAVIGKALKSLPDGVALIPILVSLQ
jgi:hypothetical protein